MPKNRISKLTGLKKFIALYLSLFWGTNIGWSEFGIANENKTETFQSNTNIVFGNWVSPSFHFSFSTVRQTILSLKQNQILEIPHFLHNNL